MVMTEIVGIGPHEARKLLKKNDLNRPLSAWTLARYERLMRAGQWVLSCDAIGVAADGSLINGQHRLQAVIKSETVQKFVVISGLDKNAFEVADVGKKRAANDVLAIEGRKNTAALAALTKMVYNYLNAEKVTTTTVDSRGIENSDVLACVRLYPQLEEITQTSIRLGLGAKPKGLLEGRLVSFALALYSPEHPDIAERLGKLLGGIGLEADDPLTVFRNRLLDEIGTANHNHGRRSVNERLMQLFMTLNASYGNRPVKLPRWSSEMAMAQPAGVNKVAVVSYLSPKLDTLEAS